MSYLFPEARLIVFTKAPVPGEVKTRLIEALGADGAARFHRQLLEHRLEQVTTNRIAPVDLYCSPNRQHDYFRQIEPRFNLTMHDQIGADLGQRMANALETTIQKQGMAVIIGTDCPALDHSYLVQAFQSLSDGNDAVIGPAEDGGYVLLGLQRFCPSLFADVEWGSGHVFEQTMSRLGKLGYSVRQLHTLWDIDLPQDLERYGEQLTAMGF